MGMWQRIHDALRALVRKKAGKHKHPTAGSIDSQSVKTTALAISIYTSFPKNRMMGNDFKKD